MSRQPDKAKKEESPQKEEEDVEIAAAYPVSSRGTHSPLTPARLELFMVFRSFIPLQEVKSGGFWMLLLSPLSDRFVATEQGWLKTTAKLYATAGQRRSKEKFLLL